MGLYTEILQGEGNQSDYEENGCYTCYGTGELFEFLNEECHDCDGTGYINKDEYESPEEWDDTCD